MEGIGNFNTYKGADEKAGVVTKNNGTVTSNIDKTDGKQLPVEDFKKEFIDTAPKIENALSVDTVSFQGSKKSKTPQEKYKNPNIFAKAGGILAGSAISLLVPQSILTIVSPKAVNKMQNLSNNLSKDEISSVQNAVFNTIEKTGLKSKGVEVIKATKQNLGKIREAMGENINPIIAKYLPKKTKESMIRRDVNRIHFGGNACYLPVGKKIVMPENELSLTLFHEAGHAANSNLCKYGKYLQKCRPLSALALPISMISLFKTKKAEGEQPKNKLDKATTFVKDNAGKLTFAAFLPMLAEEGLASIKGNKFAKQFLKPELAQKVAKTNALGFSTYATMAVFSSLGIFLGTKAKDAIAHKKAVAENK